MNQRGVTLIELLIGVSLGMIVTASIGQVLALVSRDYKRSETMVSMHEQADMALQFLTQDLRMAGHWGLVRHGSELAGHSEVSNANPKGLAIPSRCDAGLLLDLAFALDTRPLSHWRCNITATATSDALVARYASARVTTPQPNRLQIHSTDNGGDVIVDGSAPGASALQQLHDLKIMAYYVAERSALFPDLPVLRRLTLTANSRRPLLIDEEIAPGVEVMQIAVAIDTDADRRADTVMQANDPRLLERNVDGTARWQPLAVHIWLIIRSEHAGWPQQTAEQFQIGDLSYAAPTDGHLRLMVSRTIRLRNHVD
ncbi:MAG: PilW family protein [Pseudomonadota bacterium]